MRMRRVVTPQDATLSAARWLAVGATLVIVMMTTDWAARPAAQRSSPAPKVSRIDRLEAWIAGVKRHEPGTFDDVAMEISEWGDEELKQVWIDMSSVVTLVYEPRTAVFYVPRTRQNPTSGWVPYSDVE